MSSTMSQSYVCFYSITLLFVTFTSIAIGSNVSDHQALLQFRAKITDDPFGFMTSWNHTTHFCQWPGVTCSKRHHQRVTSLNLPSLKLSGSISPYIGNLSFLKELRLPNNSFNQEIPSQIGQLHRLQLLYLYNNSLSGRIPVNISSCSNLIAISLSYNQLVGEIPVEFGSLIRLKFIGAAVNHLTGAIPLSFGNLTSLGKLSFSVNYLSGSIPHTLRNVTHIELAFNRLSGIIPPSILNISSMTVFAINGNQLHGKLPMHLGTMLPNLQFFDVSKNRFDGLFPISITNASDIAYLLLELNNFSGKLPSLEKLHRLKCLSLTSNHIGSKGVENDLRFLCSLNNASSFEILYINNNYFGGMLPPCIGNLSIMLRVLELDNNFISGSIPTEIENLMHLTALNAQNNQLSSTIPASVGRLQNLVVLDLSRNKLSGQIPSSLGNLKQLIKLDLFNNNLQGSIPPSLANCKQLLGLSLYHNNLSGAIPPGVLELSSLSLYLDLSQNHLTGPLPFEVGNLKNLGMLYVSNNKLTGEIPSSLGSCTSLEFLFLNGNLFQGKIPTSLSSLRALQIIDFSNNKLSGTVPEFLVGFTVLVRLNLSYNDFEGMLPTKGIFKNSSAALVIGNNKLCGGVPEFHLPTCKFKKNRTRRFATKHKFVFFIVFGIFGVSFVLSFLFILWFMNKKKETTTRVSENSLFRLSYQALLKATGEFSSANLIGQGSFGSVYKGVLDQDSTIIAVKVLSRSNKGAYKSFKAECEALRNIKHRNLVKVLTACSSVDCHGNDFKALVYEFMVNGSLEDWLHPQVGTNEANEAPGNLDFLQRLNITIDVACALEYLHQHCKTPIIHCDLKPGNVLLDNDMVAHVGDFGLAKFLFKKDTNCSTNQSTSIGVRGTVGYAPPEYGLSNEVSTYGDIYSFGILMLEIFTGKRPTDDSFKDGLNIWNYVRLALPNRVVEIADPILLQERIKEELHTMNICTHRGSRKEILLYCLILIFEIGISCSAEIPRERIDISKVVVELCLVRDKFFQA